MKIGLAVMELLKLSSDRLHKTQSTYQVPIGVPRGRGGSDPAIWDFWGCESWRYRMYLHEEYDQVNGYVDKGVGIYL